MKSVGIRELKNNLSRYLYLVKEGETIIVTEHNKVIAEIKQPIENLDDKNKQIQNYLIEQEKLGKISLAKRNNSKIDEIIENGKNSIRISGWEEIHRSVRSDRIK
jgi:antitoxin (DNA-binding transcriptional repressor) of toxin-antitoxin stability system